MSYEFVNNMIQGEDEHWEYIREKYFGPSDDEPEEQEEEKEPERLDMTFDEAYDEIIKTAAYLQKLCNTIGACMNCPFSEYDGDELVCHLGKTNPYNWEVE